MSRKTKTGLPHTKSVVRGKVEYVYFNTGQKVDGKVVYQPLGRKDADNFGARYSAAKANRTKRAGARSALTIPQLVDRFQRSPEFAKHSVGTQKTYLVYLNRLAREFDTAPVSGFDESDIYELLDDMAAKPAAADMLLLVANQMFKWGLKRKHVASNPIAGIDRGDWESRDYEPWPESLVEEALKDDSVRLPVALLYFTAQRIGDCCRMKWSDISGDVLTITQQKTGKVIPIPIHTELASILAEAPRLGDTIMADAKGRPMKDQTIRFRLKRFGAERGFDVVPHGLRKNAVNALLEAECSTAETSAISGQSLRVVEHYAKRRNSPRMGRRAMSKWERFGNRETDGKTPENSEE